MMKFRLIASTVLVLSLSNACQATKPILVATPSAPVNEASDSRAFEKQDLTDDLRKYLAAKPYNGPVTVKIDTGLAQANNKQRRVFNLSEKHNGNEEHAKKNQDLYFDPNNLPQELNTFQGDVALPGTEHHFAKCTINGEESNYLSGVIQIAFKADALGKYEEFKTKYNVQIIQETPAGVFVRLDLSKIDLGKLNDSIKKINAHASEPLKELDFSSLASVKTLAALWEINLNYGLDLKYAHEVVLPHSPYFVGDDPASNVSVPLPPPNPSPVNEEVINSIEGFDGGDPGRGVAPNRQYLSGFKWMRAMGIPQSRTHSTGYGATIAVIDGGYKAGNGVVEGVPDIPSNRIKKRDYVSTSNVYGSETGADQTFIAADIFIPESHWGKRYHGSFAMAVAASSGDDGRGGVGVAPNAKVLQLRSTFPWQHQMAVYYAIQQGASVIIIDQDLQLSKVHFYTVMSGLIPYIGPGITFFGENLYWMAAGAFWEVNRAARDAGIALVAPAGNSGLYIEKLNSMWDFFNPFRRIILPACLPDAITVGGCDVRGATEGNFNKYWNDGAGEGSRSNYGPAIDVYAPANDMWVSALVGQPDTNGELFMFGGTSGASPAVAGVVALMKSKNPGLTATQVKDILVHNYRDTVVGAPDGSYAPLVNAFEALKAVPAVNRMTNGAAVKLTGWINSDGTFRENRCRSTPISLVPQIAPEPGRPQVALRGWFKNSTTFEVAGVRQPSVPAPTIYCGFNLRGYVGDATTGGGVAGVNVELRPGVDACDGQVIASTQTDSNGEYQFVDVAEGSYTVAINRSGYVRVCSNVTVNQTYPNGSGGTNIVTSPSLPSNATRLVLVWGESPNDLDSHLTGPMASGDRFHVYYGNQSFTDSKTSASLDIDDTTSFGPETITNTVISNQPGTYRYAIHDYSNRSSSNSNALSNSGAAVLVFRGDTLLMTLKPTPGMPGTVWNVLEMDGLTGNITPQNRMAFESNPSFVIQGLSSFNSEIIPLLQNASPKLR